MTVRTRTPDTAARARGISPDVENHTKQMLESILRPHSLEELYAMVGSFPFKAVKVCRVPSRPGEVEYWPVGKVIELVKRCGRDHFVHTEPSRPGIDQWTPGDIKQWRLASEN